MSETPNEREGRDFVAPDESQRTDDPVLAENIARESHEIRSRASELRGIAKEIRTDTELQSTRPQEHLDEIASDYEKAAKDTDDEAKLTEDAEEELLKD